MCEILFRGKRIDNGEWVVGNLFIPDNTETPTQICIGTNVVRISYDIEPESIGQYTGLTDKNGNKIFEGDILKIDGSIYYVRFHNGTFGVVVKNGGYAGSIPKVASYVKDFVEIIGNIHDNPELLGGDTE